MSLLDIENTRENTIFITLVEKRERERKRWIRVQQLKILGCYGKNNKKINQNDIYKKSRRVHYRSDRRS